MNKNKTDLLEWLGFRCEPNYSEARWLGGLISGVIVLVALILFGLPFFAFLRAFWSNDPTGESVRNTGLTLAAMLGVPFLVWRSIVAQKQVDVNEEALFNDKINAASASLYATRQISRRFQAMGERPVWRDLHEDDIVRRNAAIDALEGLAGERPDQAVRIARMLSVYVRELSREVPPVPVPDGGARRQPRTPASGLEPKRSDMQTAVRVLGRLRAKHGARFGAERIDLRRADLQGMDLSGDDLSFAGVLFGEARMHQAKLHGTQMQGANLREAQMDAATSLSAAILQGAALRTVDFTDVALEQWQLDEMFGDSSVKLPKGLKRPAHWPTEALEWHEFETQWRAWQKSIGFDPDAPGD